MEARVLHDVQVPFEISGSIYFRRGIRYQVLGITGLRTGILKFICRKLDFGNGETEELEMDQTSEFEEDINLNLLTSIFKVGTSYQDSKTFTVVQIVSYVILQDEEDRYYPAIVYAVPYHGMHDQSVAGFVKQFGFIPVTLKQ